MTETTDDALHYREISELVDMLASGDVTAEQLTELTLDRIADVDQRLGAYAFVAADEARACAADSDERRKTGTTRGPLDGIPLAVKDVFDKTGWRTEAGMSVRAGQVAATSATVVERLEQSGAIIVGKVHTTEGVYTEHTPPFRAPVNPWDPNRWVGVSSSGSGVAPAAGLCFGALGSDTGGSIRMPSASNGATGLKPTWGRVSRAGAVELAATLDHVGPICRSARDAGLMLGAIAGADPRDPTASLQPVPEFSTAVPSSLRGVRIGIDPEWSYRDVSNDVEKAHQQAEQVLADLGAELVPVELPDPTEAITDWFGVCAVQTARSHRGLYPKHRDSYGPALSELLDRGIAMSGIEYDELLQRRLIFKGQMEAVLASVDAVLIPAMSFIAPPVEKMIRMDEETTAGVHRFTVPFTLSQMPTITFPGGFTTTESGLPFPVGLQMVGSAFTERRLVDVVGAFQAVTPWNKRHPEL
ncbi:putative amidase AmiD [Mycolicibacterium chitae]|uniref:Putative amidase n=1 Tax=Mycolicibacterium chitae TaxID=1792 RepID=A0A448IEF6_MYCCI|nr:amidase [Mycolicibacterium chitae]MCV7104758.1 amidase [Mycolicibacterium chitae]BBZ01965.1 putative amidase AmiD [Mycolicibacterium chitae]VEG50790.1 putative amidase [Mycolicibacterium chitae]